MKKIILIVAISVFVFTSCSKSKNQQIIDNIKGEETKEEVKHSGNSNIKWDLIKFAPPTKKKLTFEETKIANDLLDSIHKLSQKCLELFDDYKLKILTKQDTNSIASEIRNYKKVLANTNLQLEKETKDFKENEFFFTSTSAEGMTLGSYLVDTTTLQPIYKKMSSVSFQSYWKKVGNN